MFTTTKIHELISIGNNLSADDELIVYDNNTQTTNKVSLSSIYNNYNESYLGIYPYYENRGYNSGEFCTYNNELYVCKNTIPAKSWDSSDWMGTAICQELDDIKTNVSVNTTDISTLNTVQTLTVTVGSGFTGTVQAYKIGHLVMVLYIGDVGSMTAWKDIVICDLPSNIKAITDCYSVSMSNEGKPLVVEIYKNGTSVVARSLGQTHGGQLRGTLWVLTS